MPNLQMTKTPMPEQAPDVRNHNFLEVCTGYTAEMAVNEAGRCLNCKKPLCVEGCPGQRPHSRIYTEGRRGRFFRRV
jgi:glutamate synthase (NADPH/NADH) small chain